MWLEAFRRTWSPRLDALATELARNKKERMRSAETDREVGHKRIAAGDARTATIRRRYDASVEDVWSACTEPDRSGAGSFPSPATCAPAGRSACRATRVARSCAASRRTGSR